MQRLTQLSRSLVELFPERHLYVRSGGAMKAFVLTTRKQLVLAGGVAVGALWLGVSTAALFVNLMSASAATSVTRPGPGREARASTASYRKTSKLDHRPASGASASKSHALALERAPAQRHRQDQEP